MNHLDESQKRFFIYLAPYVDRAPFFYVNKLFSDFFETDYYLYSVATSQTRKQKLITFITMWKSGPSIFICNLFGYSS